MSVSKVLYSSEKQDWETPQDLFDQLNAEFHFETDVCANAQNAKCEHYYDENENGLVQEWRGVCWMNPPYGREIAPWIKKAFESAQWGGDGGMLAASANRHQMVS